MKTMFDILWEKLEKVTLEYQKEDSDIIFCSEKRNELKKVFDQLYDKTQERYMDLNVKALDNHKSAAIFIVSTEIVNIVKYNKDLDGNHFFIGQEMFVTETILDFMLCFLNKRLKKLKIESINQYHMPVAFSCETPYFDIFSRNIFYSKEDDKLNVLDLADNLFLLEYITLLKNGIDPQSYYQ